MKRFLGRFAYMLIVGLYLAISAQGVWADPLTDEQLKETNQNPNWVASTCGAVSTDFNDSSGKKVYILGDSITHLAEETYQSTFQTEGWSTTVKGLDSRHIASTPPSPSGLGQLDDDKDPISNGKVSAVVIALGTNDSAGSENSIKDDVQKMVKKAKSYVSASTKIYWVNILDTRSDSNTNTTNKAISEGVDSDGKVIDWFSNAKAKADLASFNGGVHPTKQKDINLLVNLVLSEVNQGFATGTPNQAATCCANTGSNAPGTPLTGNGTGEQVFNYFIGKGLSNESAAAAAGNLEVESDHWRVVDGWGGGNNGGFYGIAQWDRSVRYQNLVKFAGGAENAGKLNYQLDFVWHELTTVSAYKPVLDSLRSNDSLVDKTIKWGRVYEGAITNGALQMQADRIIYAKRWAKAGASGTAPTGNEVVSDDTTECVASGGSNGKAFVLGDYAWPVDIKKAELRSGYPWPCHTTCHHDNTYAFDLSTAKAIGGKDQDAVGRDEFAISDGTVESVNIYNGIAGCYGLEFKSKDGYVYWYGHMRRPAVKEGTAVKVGTKIGELGERKCTGNGSYPHLHIDRGAPKGSPGGYVNSRDAGINDVMNALYEKLP